MELFFRPLGQAELAAIAEGAARRLGVAMGDVALQACASYCASGRDAVNIVQLAGGAAHAEGRDEITPEDVLWVAETCRHSRRMTQRLSETARVGVCAGLAVSGAGQGVAMEIECTASRAAHGAGTLLLGGMVEEEELDLRTRRLRRKGTARVSAENVRAAFQRRFALDCGEYDVSFNVPGGVPMDGPSAGIALAVALMSAITGKAPVPLLALTGEITAQGEVRPVGGVREKLAAAVEAGAQTLVIPADNWEEGFAKLPAAVYPVKDIAEVMRIAFDVAPEAEWDGVIPIGDCQLAIGD